MDLELRIEDLHGRVHRGAHRPQPSRRAYIDKADGKHRPLAIAALEDKIVQGATVMVLNAIYEGDSGAIGKIPHFETLARLMISKTLSGFSRSALRTFSRSLIIRCSVFCMLVCHGPTQVNQSIERQASERPKNHFC